MQSEQFPDEQLSEGRCGICLCNHSELGNVVIWRCCKQAICGECKDMCIDSSSRCPYCRSTMDKVVAIVNLHTFHEVKLLLNGNDKVFDISERSRRYFDRQCRDDLIAFSHVPDETSFETLRNKCYHNAIKIQRGTSLVRLHKKKVKRYTWSKIIALLSAISKPPCGYSLRRRFRTLFCPTDIPARAPTSESQGVH